MSWSTMRAFTGVVGGVEDLVLELVRQACEEHDDVAERAQGLWLVVLQCEGRDEPATVLS